MRFLLLRIRAIRQPRRWALPHEAIGQRAGRGEACHSVLPRGLVCNRFTGDSNGTHEDGPLAKSVVKRSEARKWMEIEKRGRFFESPHISYLVVARSMRNVKQPAVVLLTCR